MKRYALLIEAGRAKNSDAIDGPVEDARRLRFWLGSNSGGAWEPDEIETLSNPNATQVSAAVRRAGVADYAFVAFSGHGWIAEDGRTGNRLQKVVIGTGESIDFLSLRPKAKKCTLLCDACREVVRFKSFTENRKFALSYARESDAYSRETYRAWFDIDVLAAAEGAFFLYGCSVNQYSYEDPMTGGFFTGALIDNAADWTDSAMRDGCLPMQTALDLAARTVAARTTNYLTKQNPLGGPENRSRGNPFPFAVALV